MKPETRCCHLTLTVWIAFIICVPGLALVVENSSALSYTPIYRGVTYTFTTADGGESDDDGIFHQSRYFTTTREAEAICSTIDLEYTDIGYDTISAYAGVWKAVQCKASTFYYATVNGHVKANLAALGATEASVWFHVIVKNLGSNVIVKDILFNSSHATPPIYTRWVDNDFTVNLNWPGVYNEVYAIELYVKTYVAGFLFGGAMSDAYDNEGAYYTSIKVWSYSAGGCIAEGTEVALADGDVVPVEKLKRGQYIMGYDIASESLVTEQVLSVHKSYVNTLEVINGGALVVTPEDQPIYVKHGSYIGWVINPVELEVGWYIFCPQEDAWIPITSISFENGEFAVYEVVASDPDTFIAEGFLLDVKIY